MALYKYQKEHRSKSYTKCTLKLEITMTRKAFYGYCSATGASFYLPKSDSPIKVTNYISWDLANPSSTKKFESKEPSGSSWVQYAYYEESLSKRYNAYVSLFAPSFSTNSGNAMCGVDLPVSLVASIRKDWESSSVGMNVKAATTQNLLLRINTTNEGKFDSIGNISGLSSSTEAKAYTNDNSKYVTFKASSNYTDYITVVATPTYS